MKTDTSYKIYVLSLLFALEEYLPYMSDDEVADIVFCGEEPDALTVWRWEARRSAHKAVLERRFTDAFSRQKKH